MAGSSDFQRCGEFCVYYRSPGSSVDSLKLLGDTVSLLHSSCCLPVIICGDFNAPTVNWNLSLPSTGTAVANILCDIVLSYSVDT